MIRRLLLTSHGLANEEIENALINMLGKPLENCVVCYIPNAGDLEKDNSYIGWRKAELQRLSYDVIDIDLKSLRGRILEEKANNADIIFVEGGNTFYLLDLMRKSGFGKLLPKLLDDGKVYVGVSAGSYVVCPTIEAATWKHADRNIAGLKDLTGLGLVPFLVTVHFEEKYRNIIENAAKHTNYPIVALSDSQAVLLEGDTCKVVGVGSKEFLNGFAERARNKSK